MTRTQLLRGAAAVVVVGVVAVFFVRALRANRASLIENPVTLGWWVAIALLAFVAAVAVSGVLWGRIVARLERRPLAATEAIRVHFASWLLKYVPGQAGFVVNKVMWAQRRGTSRTLALISVVYENAFLLVASTVPMVAALLVARAFAGSDAGVSGDAWLVAGGVAVLLVFLHPRILRGVIGTIVRRVAKRRVPDSYFLSGREVIGWVAAFTVPRLINGIGVVVIGVAVADVGTDAWIPLIAAYAIAGALGIMAIFVPSGLGVRESAFVVLVTGALPLDRAIVVALVARVVSTVADVAIAAALGVLSLVKRRKEHQP